LTANFLPVFARFRDYTDGRGGSRSRCAPGPLWICGTVGGATHAPNSISQVRKTAGFDVFLESIRRQGPGQVAGRQKTVRLPLSAIDRRGPEPLPPLSHWERARERANVVATLSSSLSLRAEGRAAREGEAPAEPGSLRGRCQQRRLGTGPVVSKEVVREESTGSPLVRSV
jgi:hypothetical protein